MYIDRKVTSWIRDYYCDDEVTLEDLIKDPNTDVGWKERIGLVEVDEPVKSDSGEDIIEIYNEDGKLLYDTKSKKI